MDLPQISQRRKKDQFRENDAGHERNRSACHASRYPLVLTLTAVIVATFGAQAAPQPIIVSAHSSTAAVNCWPIDGSKVADDNATRVCRGKATWVVLVNKDDQRETVSVGRNRDEAAKEPAAQASFGPFKLALPVDRMADRRQQSVCHHPALAEPRR